MFRSPTQFGSYKEKKAGQYVWPSTVMLWSKWAMLRCNQCAEYLAIVTSLGVTFADGTCLL